eukprot:CAMPEP_0172152560 /NCGR_PEP_ID=MMETSP1050-20130122/920_1 /TAXON_ID=233186 /ORGANISM="Cryptomonas curvata, Strain CCAP979/52" /LENGTH=70 /DNA_ID=CAMNT_0012820925 /DNA_START=265 /DNA_END=473 /DNA_ORIENTATION=+
MVPGGSSPEEGQPQNAGASASTSMDKRSDADSSGPQRALTSPAPATPIRPPQLPEPPHPCSSSPPPPSFS